MPPLPFLAAALAALALPAAAQEREPREGAPILSLPIDCTLGTTCHVQNHIDRDPEDGAVADHACGSLSYDGHLGTDFALPHLAAMGEGVAVLAAADGTVRGARDGRPDISINDPAAPDVAGMECGNGVVIDHGGNWTTQYCHLARGSVAVAQGDRVEAGTPLGRVGLSGRTEFPHLHFVLRSGDTVRDPYDMDLDPACGRGRTLWAEPQPYVSTAILGAGFLPYGPDPSSFSTAHPPNVPWNAAQAGALVVWLHAFGLRAGDVVEFVVDGPGGRFTTRQETLEKDQGVIGRFTGRRAPEGGWPAGRYTAVMEIRRGGNVVSSATRSVTLN